MAPGYVRANVIVSGPIGLASLLAPDAFRAAMGIPAGDPVSFGIANGGVPLASGVAGLFGLRAPVKLSPVLGLQVVYKTAFLMGVVVPFAASGRIPTYAVPVIGIFLVFVVGNVIAIPFPYVLSGPAEAAEDL